MTTQPLPEVSMSSLSLAPSFVPAAPRVRRTAVRLTRRGRVLVVLAFLAAALVLTTVLGGWAAATHRGTPADPVRVVTVQPGDTLYDLAGEVAGPGDVRSMVHRIQELNSLPSTTVHVGQQLAVPSATSRR